MSSRSLLRCSVVWVLGVLAGGAGSALQGQSGLPEIVVNGHDFRVPAGGARMVYRFAEEGPPEVLEFLETHGRNWRVYWDEALGTPRFLRPLEPVDVAQPELLEPGADPGLLVAAVGTFIHTHAEFLGVGFTELGPPHVYRSGTSPILIFPQTTTAGIPVRGANLRVVLRENGELSWIKSFIIRDCPDPEGEFQELEALIASTTGDGSTVGNSKFQIGFTEADPPVAIPIWSLRVTDPEGDRSEHILDARTGDLLARRQVVKHFCAPPGTIGVNGWVNGVSPRREDIFGSPRRLERAQLSRLDGSVVRNQQGEVIATTNSAGFFTTRINQDNAVLSFSMEHGICHPGQNGEPDEFERLLWIVPADGGTRPLPLSPADDVNGDGVPDVTVAQAAAETFSPVLNDGGVERDEYVMRAWWLQTYHHARRMFRFVEETVEGFAMAETFQGIEPLEVRPMDGGGVFQFYAAPEENEPARVFSSTRYIRSVGAIPHVQFFIFDSVPTVFSHEVGHHIVFSLTRTTENDNRQAEDGIADALTAFTNEEPKIGYHGQNEPTDFSFKLGTDGDSRKPIRADVGDAFWTLRVLLEEGDRERAKVAHGLLLHWLHAHWGPEGQAMRFDAWDHSIVDELLAIDSEPPFCKTQGGCPTPPHGTQIRNAFRGRKTLFDAPFVRGDANVDQKIDLSDAITILDVLFQGQGQFVDCWNAVDVDNDSNPDMSDAIYLLTHLFRGGAPIPAPSEACGIDPEPPGDPGNLGCADFTCER